MPARRPENPPPDLFTATAAGAASQPVRDPAPTVAIKPPAPPTRHLLPSDLPGALKRLDDGEIHALLAAVSEEARRRGRLPPEVTTAKMAEPAQPASRLGGVAPAGTTATPAAPRSGRASGGDGKPVLTAGMANAVRAAFRAGVKPSVIARKFGLSQATVRQALAEARGRKS